MSRLGGSLVACNASNYGAEGRHSEQPLGRPVTVFRTVGGLHQSVATDATCLFGIFGWFICSTWFWVEFELCRNYSKYRQIKQKNMIAFWSPALLLSVGSFVFKVTAPILLWQKQSATSHPGSLLLHRTSQAFASGNCSEANDFQTRLSSSGRFAAWKTNSFGKSPRCSEMISMHCIVYSKISPKNDQPGFQKMYLVRNP
jgi:hypothetical protein